ncbi:hypothetical protein [Photorhabdus australis]|nr:hypothetical protein [Photorhabdus australis]
MAKASGKTPSRTRLNVVDLMARGRIEVIRELLDLFQGFASIVTVKHPC